MAFPARRQRTRPDRAVVSHRPPGKDYTLPEKIAILKLLRDGTMSRPDVRRQYGLEEDQLRQWQTDFAASGVQVHVMRQSAS